MSHTLSVINGLSACNLGMKERTHRFTAVYLYHFIPQLVYRQTFLNFFTEDITLANT